MEKTSQATITAQMRQLRRLEMLIDVVYALVILRIFTLIPRPEKGDFAWGTIVEFLLSDKGDLIMALVGMVIVIIYWTQNNTIFGNLVRTDNRHATLTIIQLFSLLLFLYACGWAPFSKEPPVPGCSKAARQPCWASPRLPGGTTPCTTSGWSGRT
jgi:uncharacterized membrane protein